MLTIDTHCHAGLDWMEPVEVLLFQMERNQVDKAVLTQYVRLFDNSYLIECARRYPGRFAVIGSVDASQPDAVKALDDWVEQGMQGIRIRLMELPTMTELSILLKGAARLNLKVSCYGMHDNFASEEFREIIELVPDLPIIIEHFAYVKFTEPAPYGKFDKILSLSKYPNVYMKIHGFGEYMPRPEPTKHPPYDLAGMPPCIDMAIDAFGADHLMIGTDSPPSSHREGYANVMSCLREYLSRRSSAEQVAIFGKTAASLFTF